MAIGLPKSYMDIFVIILHLMGVNFEANGAF
jgi:hypothetical protein